MTPPCRGCGEPVPEMRHQGNPRQWCSEACRVRTVRRAQGDDPRLCVDCGQQMTRRSMRCKACAYERHLERVKARAKAMAPLTSAIHTCDECGVEYETTRPTQRYCTAECRDRRRWRRGSGTTTTSRGYGREHQQVRAQWRAVVEAGDAMCCLCGAAIHPDDDWHLDHTPDRAGYRGAAHALCNVTDGGRRGGRVTATRGRVESLDGSSS